MTNTNPTRGLTTDGDIVENGGPGWARIVDGTENFVEVTDIGGGGYEWSEFRCWYDMRTGVYYWTLQGGCSCYSFSVDSLGELQSGDRAAAIKAARESDEEYFISDMAAQEGAARVRNFDPRKVELNAA